MLCPNSPKQNLNWFPAKPLALAPPLPPILRSTYIFLATFPIRKNDFHTFLYWETFKFLSLFWLADWQMYKSETFLTTKARWAKLSFEGTMSSLFKCSEIVSDSKLSPDTTNRCRKDSRTTQGTTGWSQVSLKCRSNAPQQLIGEWLKF